MKRLYTVLIFFISILLVGNLANAQMLNLWIDDERVVYDVLNEKYFYPHLSTFFGKTYLEQDADISALYHAGINDWRWAYYEDMMPMRTSMFGGLIPNAFNQAFGKNTNRFFMWTDAMTIVMPQPPPDPPITMYGYVTHGRTGDEEGDPAKGGSGAIISAQMNPVPAPPNLAPRYIDFGVQVNLVDPPHEEVDPDRPDNQFYTLPRGNYGPPYESKGSEAQDHWFEFDRAGSYMYNDDLNYTPEDLPYAIQDNIPDVEHPLGAWVAYDGPEVAKLGQLNIRPWSKRNLVDPDSRWYLPVAILSSNGFKANKIDIKSIRIGPDPGGKALKRRRHLRDVDRDGDKDLLLYFKISETGIWPGDEVWGFYAETHQGKGYIFMDNIETYTWEGWGGLKGAPEEFDGEELLAFGAEVYPNPFSYETNIRFRLPEAGHVKLKIYNMMGQEIQMLANTPYEEGMHIVTWNGADMSGNEAPAGIYFYRLEVGEQVLTERILLIR